MNIAGPVLLIFVNPAFEKEFANLGYASAFLFGDLQQSSLDFARNSETDALVFR